MNKYVKIKNLNNHNISLDNQNNNSFLMNIHLFILIHLLIKLFILVIFASYLIHFLYIFFLHYINDINDPTNEIYINNLSESFLKIKMVNKFNSFIRICKHGIFQNKDKISKSNHPKISVIMPIYNGGKYLYYSLRSIQNQIFRDIEIILIDDFSSDNSINIIKKYMEEDPRIRLIKNNKKRKILYSKSIAALNSKGRYIIELDQDDMFIRNDCFNILLLEAEANNLDLAQIRDFSKNQFYFSYQTKINSIKDHLIYPQETNYKTQPFLKDRLFTDNNIYLLWGLLIKTELYIKVIYQIWPIILNYQLIFHEDYTVSFFMILLAKRYKYINKFALLHLIHSKSISNKYLENKEYYLSVLFFANIMNEYYLKNNPKDINILINFINLFINCFQYGQQLYPNLVSPIIKNIINSDYLTKEIKENIFKKIGINNKMYTLNKSDMILKEFHNVNIFQNEKFDKYVYNNTISISIIIYCNEFRYLMKTIRSLLNQKKINIEIIIIYDNNLKKDLNYIQNIIKNSEIIKLIDNKKVKGLIYSLSKSVLTSKGKYILFLQSGYILYSENILSKLNHIIINNNIDIIEFNLLINNNDDNNGIKYNKMYLYKCSHIKSEINVDSLKYNKLNLEIDQNKEVLFNKLVKADLFKKIINKYKFINYNDIIYNYFDNIFLFVLFKENIKFEHINIIGVIKNIKNIKELKITKIMDDNFQKKKDCLFYINFLFEKSENSFKGKQLSLSEFYNNLNVLINKYNNISIDFSNKLLEKFNSSKYINISDKYNLNLYYSSSN